MGAMVAAIFADKRRNQQQLTRLRHIRSGQRHRRQVQRAEVSTGGIPHRQTKVVGLCRQIQSYRKLHRIIRERFPQLRFFQDQFHFAHLVTQHFSRRGKFGGYQRYLGATRASRSRVCGAHASQRRLFSRHVFENRQVVFGEIGKRFPRFVVDHYAEHHQMRGDFNGWRGGLVFGCLRRRNSCKGKAQRNAANEDRGNASQGAVTLHRIHHSRPCF
jgi:hypothetical protein